MKFAKAAVALIVLASSTVLQAEDITTDPESAAIAKRQAMAEAQKAEYDAEASKYASQKAAADAKLAFVPKSGAEGKVTLGEGAGTIEANMLVSSAIRAAASKIADRSGAADGTLLLAGDEALTVDGFASFTAQAFGVDAALRAAINPVPPTDSCEPKPTTKILFAPVVGAAISAIAGALRTDTEIRGIKTDLESAFLARAVAENRPNVFVFPDQLISPDIKPDNPVIVSLCKLKTLRDAASSQIPAKPPEDQKEHIAALQAAVARYDAFLASLTKPDDKESVPLAAAYRESILIPASSRVLRVYVDKAGGSLLTRRNLWTALGVNAVGISGGLIASYSLIDPSTGRSIKAGTLRCGTGLAGLRDVRGNKEVPAVCLP